MDLDSPNNRPIFVRAMEELDPGKLRQKTMPPATGNNDKSKIFQVT